MRSISLDASRSFSFARRREDAVDDLGIDAVAVHLLDAQVRVARPANALLTVLVQAGRRHLVDPQLLARHVLRAGRTDAARQAEGRAVVGRPIDARLARRR